MRRLLIATTNPGKLREIQQVLAEVPVTLLSLRDVPAVQEPDETGESFQENARIKALYYDRAVATDAEPRDVVAEDSGLVIDALNGEPGVRSARFLRPDASYPERFAEIYRRLDQATAGHSGRRAARFICAVAVARGGRLLYETRAAVEGEIAHSPSGTRGFGYDPIFYYPPYGRTLAEVSDEEKLRVGHRGQAFRALAGWLRRDSDE